VSWLTLMSPPFRRGALALAPMVVQIGSVPAGRSVGTAVDIAAEPAMEMLRRVQSELGHSPRRAAQAVGSVSVEFLRAEGRPLQRIESGLMQRSWSYRLTGRGATSVAIGNTARSGRGHPYPLDVEERFGPARRIIGKHFARISAEALADVRDGIRAAATTRQFDRPSRATYRGR